MESFGLQRTASVLRVNGRTMKPMIEFLENSLGFTVGSTAGRGPWFATLDRDGQTIMLECRRRSIRNRQLKGWAAYFWVNDIERTQEELLERGARLKGPIVDKPYGCTEVVAIAPDRREFVFGEPSGT